MKRVIVVLCSTVLIMGMGWRPPEPPVVPQTIKEIVQQEYPDGNVKIGVNLKSTDCEELINKEFDHLTSGIVFKQVSIHPSPGVYDFSKINYLMTNADEYNQTVYMHSPIGPQCSTWAKDDNRTPEELEINLHEFLQAIAPYSYYSNVLYQEVVNETIDDGVWFGPKIGNDQWENPWYTIGLDSDGTPSYIRMAFADAMQYSSPFCKLVWNQHTDDSIASWRLLLSTVARLKAEGYRIDAIGWQGHVDVGWEANLPYLRQIIEQVQAMGMDFIVTEMDVFIKNGESLEAQAATYKAIIETVLEYRNAGVVGVSFWSVSDKCSWRYYWYPGLFDENEVPKPAYHSVQDALLGR